MLYLFSIFKNSFLYKDTDFSADKTDLKNNIIALAKNLEYEIAEAKTYLKLKWCSSL